VTFTVVTTDAAANPPRIARGICCPACTGNLERIARRWPDRMLSLWVPVRRYRCTAQTCGWQGVLRRWSDMAPTAPKRSG
jgi:hypothetical protein